MSDSYTNLLYHIVFSTKDRRPLIAPEYEVRLYDYLGGTIREVGGITLELNGTKDHVGANHLPEGEGEKMHQYYRDRRHGRLHSPRAARIAEKSPSTPI